MCIRDRLGTLAGVEDDVKVEAGNESYTRPEEVEDFVNRTGVDLSLIHIYTPTSPNTASHIAFSSKIPTAQPRMISILTAMAKIIFSRAMPVSYTHLG